jgi:hypothetical protein
MNFFRKKHKYETQSDLQDLSVEEKKVKTEDGQILEEEQENQES